MVLQPSAKKVESGGEPTHARNQTARPLTDAWFDFPDIVKLRQSYVIASTPRCGSTFLSTVLWQTGVLGAPAEYWSYHKRAAAKTIGTRMMERLQAMSRADYLAKLLACRTSRNGVFGVKVHYNDFKESIASFPDLLDRISPTKFIHIERLDKIAQAVSMARALQTGEYSSLRKSTASGAELRYDEDLISTLIVQAEEQNKAWQRWFEDNDIVPFTVTYEELAADKGAVARSVIELLGAEDDRPHEVRHRIVEKQSDGINKQWISRYKEKREPQSEPDEVIAGPDAAEPHDNAEPATGEPHIFDRFDAAKRKVKNQTSRNPAYLGGGRLRRRYEAIIAQNRHLFDGARVLNVECGDGRWSLAAMDAGAKSVVGIDNRRKPLESARGVFSECGISPEAYEFVHANTIFGMRNVAAGEFDLILCPESAELPDPFQFFNQLHRLEPSHVILDTELNGRPQAVATFRPNFRAQGPDKPTADAVRGRFVSITCIPNHELIERLSDHFNFDCRPVDWEALNSKGWAGLEDYERSRRGTYVLDRRSRG